MKLAGWAALLRDRYRSRRRRREKRKYTPRTYPDYLRHCGANVGSDCWIASMEVEVGVEPFLMRIGDRVFIDRDVALLTHDGAAWVFRHLVPDLQVYGPIVIGDDCVIGRGATVCSGVRIGSRAVVCPGSVVISNVPAAAVVSGVPARVIGSVRTPAAS